MKKQLFIMIVLAAVLVVGLCAPVLADNGNGYIYKVQPPKQTKNYITIILPDAYLKVERYGTMRYVDVDFNDGTWRIQLAKECRIWDVKGGPARKLIVNENGGIEPNVWFMCGEAAVTRL